MVEKAPLPPNPKAAPVAVPGLTNSEAAPSSLAVYDSSQVADMASSVADRARRNP